MEKLNNNWEGSCACEHVRYKVAAKPLITHCCHCRFCQRQTGTAFALNALVDADQVSLLKGTVEELKTPSPSGRGQNITRCPKCRIALWSSYYMGGIKDQIRFIRVGTLDNPDQFPPDVHIFTSTKQPWVTLPENAKTFENFYNFDTTWTKENNNFRKSLLSNANNL